jgi:hypothetical protein
VLLAAALAPQRAPAASPRIVAVGDIHGDLEALVGILRRAGLIDSARNWTGGSTVLVQTGDFMDRGPSVRGVMDLLISLQESAPKHGGRVHVLMGNHEGLNLLGVPRDASPATLAQFADAQSEARRNAQYDDYTALSAAIARQVVKPIPLYQPPSRERWLASHPPGFVEYMEAIGPGGRYGKWLRSLPAVVSVGDTMFMHAGVDPANAPARFENITQTVKREVSRFDELRRDLVAGGWALPWFTMEEVIIAARFAGVVEGDPRWDGDRIPTQQWTLVDPQGPLWFSGLATAAAADLEPSLDRILKRSRVKRLVLGHSVMANGRIGQRFGGRVVLIDTGMLSSHFHGRASALEIRDGRLGAIYEDGNGQLGSEPERDPASHSPSS